MPDAPKRLFTRPARRESRTRPELPRGKTAERGYDGDWRALRLDHLSREPLCRMCQQLGRVTAASMVDHITPIKGREDPLRLADSNLQSLCVPCHAIKTASDGSRAKCKKIVLQIGGADGGRLSQGGGGLKV